MEGARGRETKEVGVAGAYQGWDWGGDKARARGHGSGDVPPWGCTGVAATSRDGKGADVGIGRYDAIFITAAIGGAPVDVRTSYFRTMN